MSETKTTRRRRSIKKKKDIPKKQPDVVIINNSKEQIPAKYLYSEKGNKCLHHEGHIFYRDRQGQSINLNGITFWRCSQYISQTCHKRMHTKGDYIFASLGSHNHDIVKTSSRKTNNRLPKAESKKLKSISSIRNSFF